MAKLLPLHSGAGQLVIGQRPCTAPSTTPSSTRRHTGGGSRQPWTQADKVRPVTSYPGQWLILEEVEPLIHSRLTSIKSALMAVDPDGTGLVSKEEFRLVLKSLLPVSQSLLDTLLNEISSYNISTVSPTPPHPIQPASLHPLPTTPTRLIH
ncbi:EF-hand calcium-binding domain-containing protein 6 [Lates japonicus]|uniref:EF-hand calcium-binding domain-containing protein 6 n=1 Tax=Lates japonicus TaxID=270547 RepID=A0AAD3M5Y2_LATJO|nr:EF-hand calcium-binding domain-containing protein 6 [Lates japonicus]